MTDVDTDRALDAMAAAAEAARTANHAAYDAPRTTASVYARVGELHSLLCRVNQLAEVLGEHAGRLAADPALRADNGGDPREFARVAGAKLRQASQAVTTAATAANDAWSAVSPLYLDEPGG